MGVVHSEGKPATSVLDMYETHPSGAAGRGSPSMGVWGGRFAPAPNPQTLAPRPQAWGQHHTPDTGIQACPQWEPAAARPRTGLHAPRARWRETPRARAGSQRSSTPGCHPWPHQVPSPGTGLCEPWDTQGRSLSEKPRSLGPCARFAVPQRRMRHGRRPQEPALSKAKGAILRVFG